MDGSTLVSFLRTPVVYVDKRQFWVYFKVTDAFGSPIFSNASSNGVTILGSVQDDFGGRLEALTCSTGTELGSLSSTSGTWIYTCSGLAREGSFSNSSAIVGSLNVTASNDSTSHTFTVGGTGQVPNLNSLTLAQTPRWWHPDLRYARTSLPTPYSADYAARAYPTTPLQPIFLTSPTYPIYEEETFTVHIFNAASYSAPVPGVFAFTLYVEFNYSQVEYVSATYDKLFPSGSVDDTDKENLDGSKVTLISVSSVATQETDPPDFAQNNEEGTPCTAANNCTYVKNVNGFFRYAAVSFKLKSGAVLASDGLHYDTGIKVSIAEVANDGNTVMVVSNTDLHNPGMEMKAGSTAIYASIFDARLGKGSYGGMASSGTHVLAASQRSRFLLYNYASGGTNKDHGRIFNRRAIDGSDDHDTHFQATLVNDRMPYDKRNTAHHADFYDTPVLHTCAPESASSSANYEPLSGNQSSVCSVRTKIALGTDTANSRVRGVSSDYNCSGQPGGTCTGTADFRIVSPRTLGIELSHTTLSRIVPAGSDETCSTTIIASSAYQTARVRVYADDLDVTSWATGMKVENASYANFVQRPGATDQYDRNLQNLVRGKAPGSTRVLLHGQLGAASVALTVDGTSFVAVTEVVAKVVTDIEWKSEAPPLMAHPSTTTAVVTVKQEFSKRPAGTSRGHYGYLFVRAYFDDGTWEEVHHEDIVTIVRTPNLLLTPPGESDEHANSSALVMYNQDTQRHMVTLTKAAVSECVETSVQVNITRCNATIGTGFPQVNVAMPNPTGIAFNLSINLGAVDLTPSNDGASFAPFAGTLTSTSSSFQLTVFFSDGSSVDTYAEEPDSGAVSILYYSTNLTCATVDNQANTLTVVEGAACSEVEIRVNVTFGGLVFVGRDAAALVRLQSLTTTASAYPAGGGVGAAADLSPLPCNASFERFALQTLGVLSTGAARSISSSGVVAYVSSNLAAAILDGTNRVAAASGSNREEGSAQFGGTAAEFNGGWNTEGVVWNSAGVAISPFTVTVNHTYDAQAYNYDASSWNSIPGGAQAAGTSGSPSASSTLILVQNGKLKTTF
jgi:hypothetical protein